MKILSSGWLAATTACSLAIGGAHAQQPPGAARAPFQVPGATSSPITGKPAPPPVPPRDSPAPGKDELNALLQAQTDAIRALSGRIEQVEQRLRQLEQRRP